MTTTLATDDHGNILGFAHHDGSLEGVLLDRDGTSATLIIRSSDGMTGRLVLRGIVGLHVQDLRQGNVVLSIQAWDVAVARERHPDLLRLILERLYLDGDSVPSTATILRVIPSYGADVLAVCHLVDNESCQ